MILTGKRDQKELTAIVALDRAAHSAVVLTAEDIEGFSTLRAKLHVFIVDPRHDVLLMFSSLAGFMGQVREDLIQPDDEFVRLGRVVIHTVISQLTVV